jgi:hypothetical protein
VISKPDMAGDEDDETQPERKKASQVKYMTSRK